MSSDVTVPGWEAATERVGSVADSLARQLQDSIASGEFTVGSSLPSERGLMTRYNVSRTTVREALRVLGARGLISVRRGRSGGSFIANPSPDSVVRSLDLFIKGHGLRFVDIVYAREAIEPAAAAQAALSRRPGPLRTLQAASQECERVVFDVAEFVEANIQWHFAVADASGNPLFMTVLRSISAALHAATDLKEFDLATRKLVVGVHWQIFDAIRLGDAAAARRRMGRHLSAYRDRLSSMDLASAARG